MLAKDVVFNMVLLLDITIFKAELMLLRHAGGLFSQARMVWYPLFCIGSIALTPTVRNKILRHVTPIWWQCDCPASFEDDLPAQDVGQQTGGQFVEGIKTWC